MVNISKFSGLASKTLKFLKPSTRKVVIGLGSIYGGTVLIGSILGRQEELERRANYKYVPPKIGENGIVKADTIYRDGTKQPESIYYHDEYNNLIQTTDYDKNGKMKEFVKYDYDPIFNKCERTRAYDKYGELYYDNQKFIGGASYTKFKSGGHWSDYYYDPSENK